MEDRNRQKRSNTVVLNDRKKAEFTGITRVKTFDEEKVVLESDYGLITVKGSGMHVNKLSVEKGDVDIDGNIDSIAYTELSSISKRGSAFVERLLR